MIYTIGMFGFLAARWALNQTSLPGRKKTQRGAWVWQTRVEAQAAADETNARNLATSGKSRLCQNATWVVVGVVADWDNDTDIAPQCCPYPTANELIRDCTFVELQQPLPL